MILGNHTVAGVKMVTQYYLPPSPVVSPTLNKQQFIKKIENRSNSLRDVVRMNCFWFQLQNFDMSRILYLADVRLNPQTF